MKAAFKNLHCRDELEWLRLRRNQLVHFAPEHGPAITVDAQWSNQDEFEKDARRAVALVSVVLFANPWT